ncbi:MAG: cellulose synthase subunit BcsC-related outer membrane protein, partial [Vampirovibrionales bacterium]
LESYAKLEYAMLLLDMKIPEAEWAEPNLVRKLYQEVAGQPVTNAGVLMSLARLSSAVGEPFAVSWRYYEQAMDLTQNDPDIIHEAANFLKSQGNHPELNLAPYFHSLLQRCPNDVEIQLALAEYLSWNEATRDESIKMMANILASHPDQQADIERLVAENVQWLRPSASLIPYLRTLEGYYPNNPHIKIVLAKCYLQSGGNADMGFSMLQQLHEQYPTDAELTKAYIDALMSTKGLHRKAALRYLGELVESCPSDYELKMKYVQMLIYDRQYPRAIAMIDEVLAQNPTDPRAISLRGYAMLWSGRKFEARDFLEDARSTVPNQPLILVTLARVYREIGRFDKAMILLEEVHRLRPVAPPGTLVHQDGIPIHQTPAEDQAPDGMQPALDQSSELAPTMPKNVQTLQELAHKAPSKALLQALAHSHTLSDVALLPQGIHTSDWIPASYEREAPVSLHPRYPSLKVSVSKPSPSKASVSGVARQESGSQRPYAQASSSLFQAQVQRKAPSVPVSSVKTLVTLTVSSPQSSTSRTGMMPKGASIPVGNTQQHLQRLTQSTQTLEGNLQVLDALQAQTKRDIQKLSRRMEGLSVGHEDTLHIHHQHSLEEEAYAQNMTSRLSIGVQEPLQSEPLALTMYDDAPVSDMDVMVAEEAERLSQEMNLSMRPTLRAGYVYSKQEGGNAPATIGDVSDRTFNMRTSGVQSQLSFSMTPRLRLRGGVSPRRIYLPDRNLDPRSTWSYQYALGYTYKKSDKWTWDGDLAFTNFTQPGNVNVTGQQTFHYDFNDTWHTNFGFRRTAVDSSLLSFAGQRGRTVGNVWRDEVVGQARDNTVFLGLTATPNRFWDMGLGYEFGWITGHHIPTNFRNQVNGTVGFTLPILDTHSIRLGANTSWMGYTKDSTVGFFQIMGVPGSGSPVSDPILGTGVPVGTRFGGYFSPESFFTIGGRADLAGSFFKKRIEYKLGGGIGFQGAASRLNNVANTNVFTANAQGLLMWNITEWLGLYGNAEYQMAGDLYNRFRWGAGAVIRPNWRAVTPVIKP